MKLSLIILFIISAVFNQSIFNHAPLRSNVLEDYKNENKELDSDKNKNKYNFPYVLGPGDKLFIRFLGLAELSGDYTIGVDGYLDMPLIDELYVEDLTLEELNKNLDIKYAKYLKSVNIKAKIVSYRPIRVYVMGEVARPGLRTLTGTTTLISGPRRNLDNEDDLNFDINNSYSIQPSTKSLNSEINFPTVFDALKASNGITPYTDLSEIIVLRNEPESKGGGKLQAKLNFIDLFIKGDQSQNIRIFDGDTIIVKASEK